jgi:hypothetical protein
MYITAQNRSGLKVAGHNGTWYVLNESYYRGQIVYLLEHETFGEDAAALIVTDDLTIVMDDVWNGFDDLD